MIIARQSTARTIMVGPVLDAAGVAVTDGVVADFEGSVNGGDPVALNGSATLTHRGVGFYSLALTAADLATVGSFEVVINDTVNTCPIKPITVVEEAVYDAHFASGALGFLAAADDATLAAIAAVDAKIDIIDTTAAAILVDTAEIGAAGAGLTNINLPNQTMDIVGNITGNLSGSVGSVTGLTASNLDATISSRASQTSVDDLPTNAELATSQASADDATLAAIAALNNLSIANVRTAVGMAAADLDTQLDDLAALLAVVDNYVDDLEGRLTEALSTSLQAHGLGIGRIVMGSGSTPTTLVFSTVNDATPSAVDDFYNDRSVIFTSGALTLQAVTITNYVGATKVATISSSTGSAANGVTAILV
jgi:hypothetical protein